MTAVVERLSLLLEPGVRFEKLILERGNLKRRPPMDFK